MQGVFIMSVSDPLEALHLDVPASYKVWMSAYAKSCGTTATCCYKQAIYEYICKHSSPSAISLTDAGQRLNR